MIQAVILAAGKGSRLNGLLNGRPKCMLDFGGRPLIELQIECLRAAGVKRIALVVGHGADYVRRALPNRDLTFITNELYAETNSLYSLWLARDWVDSAFLMINSDVLAHPAIFRRLLDCEGSALAYDSSSGAEDEHMKIVLRDGCIARISKSLDAPADGENVGIVRYAAELAPDVFAEAGRLLEREGQRHWAPAVVDAVASRTRFGVIDVADLPWAEIDFPEDYEFARTEVWPRVAASLNGNGHTALRSSRPTSKKDWPRIALPSSPRLGIAK